MGEGDVHRDRLPPVLQRFAEVWAPCIAVVDWLEFASRAGFVCSTLGFEDCERLAVQVATEHARG